MSSLTDARKYTRIMPTLNLFLGPEELRVWVRGTGPLRGQGQLLPEGIKVKLAEEIVFFLM